MKDDTISRQAAIIQLSHNKTGDDDCDVIVQKDIETIKLLPSAQPSVSKTEIVDDCISRQAALKGLENLNIASFYEENEHSKEAYTEVKAMLKALPTCTVFVPVDDCISRAAVIDALYDWSNHTMTDAEAWHLRQVIGDIKSMPFAQSTMGQANQGDTVNERAVKFLDLFTKTYCRDKSVTDDLKFRCSECKFEMPDKKCLVKCMARKLCPDYKDFGSMGDL